MTDSKRALLYLLIATALLVITVVCVRYVIDAELIGNELAKVLIIMIDIFDGEGFRV